MGKALDYKALGSMGKALDHKSLGQWVRHWITNHWDMSLPLGSGLSLECLWVPALVWNASGFRP